MTKRRCCECDRLREPYRPVRRGVDRLIAFVCKSCWRALAYAEFMWDPMSDEDAVVMGKRR